MKSESCIQYFSIQNSLTIKGNPKTEQATSQKNELVNYKYSEAESEGLLKRWDRKDSFIGKC